MTIGTKVRILPDTGGPNAGRIAEVIGFRTHSEGDSDYILLCEGNTKPIYRWEDEFEVLA